MSATRDGGRRRRAASSIGRGRHSARPRPRPTPRPPPRTDRSARAWHAASPSGIRRPRAARTTGPEAARPEPTGPPTRGGSSPRSPPPRFRTAPGSSPRRLPRWSARTRERRRSRRCWCADGGGARRNPARRRCRVPLARRQPQPSELDIREVEAVHRHHGRDGAMGPEVLGKRLRHRRLAGARLSDEADDDPALRTEVLKSCENPFSQVGDRGQGLHAAPIQWVLRGSRLGGRTRCCIVLDTTVARPTKKRRSSSRSSRRS